MKAFRGTAILSLCVVALALYTAWEYKKAADTSGDAPEEKHLFSFNSDQVEQVQITHGAETMLIVRESDSWKMKKPFVDDAETSVMDAFIYSVRMQKGKTFRGEDESKGTKWAEFGLEPPGSVVEITSNKKTETLAVSSKNAFDGSYYIRQGNELMLGDHGLAQIVGRDASAFRSRRLWREGEATVESVQATVNLDKINDKFTVKREGENYQLEPKPVFPVDEVRLSQWVRNILALTPSEIASDALSEEEKRSFLLLKPSLQANVQFKKTDGGKGEWNLTIGQDKADDVYVYTNQRATVYKTNSKSLDKIRVDRQYFRDSKHAFKVPVEEAHEVHISKADFKHDFIKDGSTWKLKSGDKDLELNADKLADLFHAITSLEAAEFPQAKEAKGFKGDQHLVVLDEKGKIIFELKWGEEFKAKQAYNKGMTLRFVQTNLEKDPMGVNASKIASLIDASLVKKKSDGKKVESK